MPAGMKEGGAKALELSQLRRLEIASLAEATTLVLLVCVAVPLKHLAGYPVPVSMLGPVHGLAFLAYVWIATQTIAGGGWRRSDAIRLYLAGFVPFGGFLNLPFLARRAALLR